MEVGDVGKPMSPEEILSARKQIPGYVYDAFNECIAEAIRGGTGYFTRWALQSAILRRVPSCLAPRYRLDTNDDLPGEARLERHLRHDERQVHIHAEAWMSDFTWCARCRNSPSTCARCWLDEVYHRLETHTNDGLLVDLRSKDAAASTLFDSPGWVRFKLVVSVDHGGYTTGDSFDIELSNRAWHVSVAGKPHAALGDFESIYSNSLDAIVRSALQFAVTRHAAVSGKAEALIVTEGSREVVLPLLVSFVSNPASTTEASA